MFPILAGLGLIILGLVGAFFGYRIFRVLLPIYGGVAGFLLAWGWWGQNAWLLALIVGVVLAAVFAVLAYAFWSAMVAFGGLIMGGALGIAIGTSLNLWGWLTVLIAIATAIVFAALFYWVRNEMVIISTAVSGGTLVGRGVGELFGWRSGVEGVINPNPAWLAILVLAVGVVAFIAGLLFQWRAYAKMRWYSGTGAQGSAAATPSAAAAAPSYATRAAANIDAAAGAAGSAVTGGGAAVAGAAAAAAAAATVSATSVAAETNAAVDTAASGARSEVAALADTAVEAVSDAGETVSEAAEEVTTEVAGAADTAGSALAGAGAAAVAVAAGVKMDAEEAVDAVAEPVAEDAADAVADVTDELASGVAAEAESGLEHAAESADDALEGSEAVGEVRGGLAAAAVGAGALLADADDSVADAAAEAQAGASDAVEAAENKVEAIVDSAANTLDVDLEDNKVSKMLAELENSFEGLEESAKFKEALNFVEGIGPVFADKLKELGVNNVLDLLRSGATRKGRADLAEKSGIAGKLILEWVNHADLYRVKGVGSEFADLLEAAGVDTVPELAQRNPTRLFERMQATNEEKRLVRRAPHASEVEDWVAQAKNLPRIIQY
jgi:predicted flap endonuclease-1-like 5' DNA nuclease